MIINPRRRLRQRRQRQFTQMADAYVLAKLDEHMVRKALGAGLRDQVAIFDELYRSAR